LEFQCEILTLINTTLYLYTGINENTILKLSASQHCPFSYLSAFKNFCIETCARKLFRSFKMTIISFLFNYLNSNVSSDTLNSSVVIFL